MKREKQKQVNAKYINEKKITYWWINTKIKNLNHNLSIFAHIFYISTSERMGDAGCHHHRLDWCRNTEQVIFLMTLIPPILKVLSAKIKKVRLEVMDFALLVTWQRRESFVWNFHSLNLSWNYIIYYEKNYRLRKPVLKCLLFISTYHITIQV